MSGAPRVRSMNVAESEAARAVLGPAGNKSESLRAQKLVSKPLRKAEKSPDVTLSEEKKANVTPASSSLQSHSMSASSILRRHEQFLHSSLSLNASCSSDASTDSFHSRASTGRLIRSNSVGSRRKQFPSRPKSVASSDGAPESPPDCSSSKKRCAWVTANTEPCYAALHDEEWGVPVHDDRKLFELLVLSCALAELTWPTILSKRDTFREVFADFDPAAISKFNVKKIIAPGSTARSLLSELKLRAIIDNARQVTKVIEEFGSFDKYIWSFVNHKPIVNRFRYPRQVPAKTPKADVISKDMIRRGFRSMGPTVIYSFMQVAGITNDHLTGCFRFQECQNAAAEKEENGFTINDQAEEKSTSDNVVQPELLIVIDELSLSSE